MNYVTQLESALTNYFLFSSVDPLSVSSFPSPQTSSGTRKFTGTRRRCGFLWKMWTAKSSYITSTFCWRASLRRMSTRWSSLSLCSSRFPLNILSGLYQTSGWVRIFGLLSTSILFIKHSFYFLVGRIQILTYTTAQWYATKTFSIAPGRNSFVCLTFKRASDSTWTTANVSAGHYLLPDLKAVFVSQSFRAKSDLERYKLWFEFLCRSYIKFLRYG